MRLASCRYETRAPGGYRFEAGRRYVVPELVAGEWFKLSPPDVRISTLKNWERPYFGQDLNGKTLWVSRGCGFGDQLVLSGVLRAIKRRWPSARLLFSTKPGAHQLFGMDDPDSEAAKVFQFVSDCEPFDEWRTHDFHKIVEEIVELDREPDQTDIWTTHFRFFGLPEFANDPAACRPVNIITDNARSMADAWMLENFGTVDRPFLFYQLASTSPIRSQSPERVTACLAALRDAFPDLAIVAVGGEFQRSIPLPAGVIPCIGHHPRIFVALVERASAIVCPDSCVNHIAAGLDDQSPPVVSLWSSFSPESRIATYPNQLPLYNRLPCSPCFMHDMVVPPLGCPLYRNHCRGLDGITEAQIIEAVTQALSASPRLPLSASSLGAAT